MKKLTYVFMFLIGCFSIFAENNLRELLNNEGIYDWHNLPKTERAFGVDSKIVYKIDKKKISDLKNERPYLLSSVVKHHLEKYNDISKSDILQYLNSKQRFILHDYNQSNIEYNSYKKFKINEYIIGESSFCALSENLQFDAIATYHMYFVNDDGIYQFWMEYRCNESEKKELANLTEVFSYENNNLYWRKQNSRYDFFLLLNKKDKNLPKRLIEFQQKYDDVCSNLKIDGKSINFIDKMIY